MLQYPIDSQIQVSPCFFLPCGSNELLTALNRSKPQLSPSRYQAVLASKQKIITNLSSTACSKFGVFIPLDLEEKRGIWEMACSAWRGICLHWHSQPVNRNTLASVRVREQKVNRKCLRTSGKAGASCSPDESIASTTLC